MDKYKIVLAALAASRGKVYTPVQIQKLLFLIDKNIPEIVQGPHFAFQPYAYGPFDKNVYNVLDELAQKGLVEIVESEQIWKKYRLTSNGQELGQKALESINKTGTTYIHNISNFVISLSFTQLISAIYKAYPEMKKNSVFRD